MRIIVFSDTHGNSRCMREIFERNEDADAFIFLGDGERELDTLRKCYPDKTILNVAGNCDYGSMTLDNDIFIADGVKILFTHGHNWGVKFSTDRLFYKAKEIGAEIVLFGHTHCRFYQYDEGVHILNPGSAGCPRDGKPQSYAFIDITKSGIMCSHVDLYGRR